MSNPLAVFLDFENIAIWAQQEFIDFELTPLMEFLQSRGPVVVKRAYADWSRFRDYRDDMMSNSIDLTQLYSVRVGKNRADIRIVIDALETATTRPHIQTFVLVSGDSDFGPLAAKLREYGRYVIGIGPRKSTHPLLAKSCDEFVYLETVLGQLNAAGPGDVRQSDDLHTARELLHKALLYYGQRGEIPVLATRLKSTMLSMNPTFNEANLGPYTQFSAWLEDSTDMVRLLHQGLQLYVAPAEFLVPPGFAASQPHSTAALASESQLTLEGQYRRVLARLKVHTIDLITRRDVLRDIYRELSERPAERTTEQVIDDMLAGYDARSLARSKTMLRTIWQVAFRQRAFSYQGTTASTRVPVALASEIDSEATLICRTESGFVYALVQEGVEIDRAQVAAVLLNDPSQEAYVDELLNDLRQRGAIIQLGERYTLPSRSVLPLDHADLQVLRRDMEQVPIQAEMLRGPEGARLLANVALQARSRDFAAAAQNYLLACRLQHDAIKANNPDAAAGDLLYYLASYASVKAGALSQVERDYNAARPYYVAFFVLVQDETPLWERMRGLINPMLSYYWANAGRDLGLDVVASPASSAPHQIAAQAALHSNPALVQRWETMTEHLAHINPGVLRRIVDQLRLGRADSPAFAAVADRIETMLVNGG